MTAHLEPIVYTLRIYANGDSFGELDPYIFVATVMKLDNNTAMIHGGLGEMNQSINKQIKKTLKEELKVEKMWWKRPDGSVHEFKI